MRLLLFGVSATDVPTLALTGTGLPARQIRAQLGPGVWTLH